MKQIKSSERGQIVVLLALVLVAMLGVTALAVDGATIFSDRRFDQGAADAVALAGAGKIAVALENGLWRYETLECNAIPTILANGRQVAIDRAATNSVVLDGDISDNHGVQVTCYDDPTTANGSYKDKYIDVTVMITSVPQTSFAQLVFTDELKNTVKAVARVRPRTTLSYGYAIASMGSGCGSDGGGIDIHGSVEVDIQGAGIFSNTCLSAEGTKVSVDVTDPHNQQGINYRTTFTTSGSPTFNPLPSAGGAPIPKRPVPAPDCISGPNTDISGSATLNPGTYRSISLHNGLLTLNPGLYCITTGGFLANGGTIVGDGVTIYIIGGGFDVGGNVSVNLSAPVTYVYPAIKGMLIYMAEGNTSGVALSGNSTSAYYGTVYAPDSDILAGGTSSMIPTINTQLVGKYVEVFGNSDLDIIFNSTDQFQFPSSLDMME